MNPYTHKCDVGTCDYSEVAYGVIRCDRAAGGCGRVWTRTPTGWLPDPRPVKT